MLQFLRFTYTGKKIGKHIKFPKNFNLRAFVSENVDSKAPKEEQTSHVYSLYGVIVHAGRSTRAGHYYSFVKRNNKWYMCNDDSISEVRNIDQVLKQNAYMLIYQYRIRDGKKTKKKQVAEKASAPKPAAPVIPTPALDLNLSRTKSLSAEIMESHTKKNNGEMPLSGFFEGKEDVNSDEEEEKLVAKEPMTEKEKQKFTELDYIMDNFEDVNFDDIKNLDIMKNLSIVSLNDEIVTPELKTYISRTIMKQKAERMEQALPLNPTQSTSSTAPGNSQNNQEAPKLKKIAQPPLFDTPEPEKEKPAKFAEEPEPDSILKSETDIKKYLSKKRDLKAQRKKQKAAANSQKQASDPTNTARKGSDKYKGKNGARKRGKRAQKAAKIPQKSKKAQTNTQGKFDTLVQKILNAK